jgi:ABC-type multidrug transport system fused ATPase/permease subunit
MGRVSPIFLVARRKTDLNIDIAKASVAADRILDMRGKDRVDGDLVSLDIGNIGDNDMGVKIQFQNVWFRYPTRDVPILNGINLTVSTPVVHCKRH